MMNPYHKFLDLPESETRPDYYGLLGVPRFAEDIKQIHAAAVTRGQQLRSWDNSKFYLESNAVLDKVAQASLVLEDPLRKAAYDAQLRRQLGLPAARPVELAPPSRAIKEPARIVTPDAPDEEPLPELPIRHPKKSPADRNQRGAATKRTAADDSKTNVDGRFLKLAGGLITVTLLAAVAVVMWSGRKSEPMPNQTVATTNNSDTLNGTPPPNSGEPVDDTTGAANRPSIVGNSEVTNSVGMKLVLIPAGEFTMGSPAGEAERQKHEGPQHQVHISQPFYMGVSEVTQGEYESVMGTNPSRFKTVGGQSTSKFPVEQVSWNDAVEFCQKLSVKDGVTYRLPTEAEWEYAARAGTTTPFHFGSTLNGDKANVNGGVPYGTTTKGPDLGRTTTVGAYSKNDFGLFDMHGNVWEWCEDIYDEKAYASRSGTTTDPKVTSGLGGRVLRGGSWNVSSRVTRSAGRTGLTPGYRGSSDGFRVVFSASAVRTPATATVLAVSIPARIADRLKLPISVDFRRTPLQDAIEEIGNKIGTRFVIDGDALKLSGYTKNMPQTFQHDQQPASIVLADMLKRYGDMCLVVDDAKQEIVVTTLASANQQGLKPFNLTPGSTASSSSPTPPPVPASANELAKTYTSKSTNMELVLIPAGEFTMGSPAGEEGRSPDEGPQHQVRISQPFYMGVHEVTQGEYKSVMGTNPSWFSKTGGGSSKVSGQNTSTFPVEQVSWNDAVEFCQKLSVKEGMTYRLPTEAEWEYAARAGTTTPFHFGSTLNGDKANVDGNFPYGRTTRGQFLRRTTTVGAYSKNDFGLFDMHGNVWEWCEDIYDAKAYASRSGRTTDPKVTSGLQDRVLRGGSWYLLSRNTRSANRGTFSPDNRNDSYGFRVVISAAAVRTP